MKASSSVVLIGAGNVGTHLARRMKATDIELLQIYSRSLSSAENLGTELSIPYTSELASIRPDADVYVFAVSDDVLPDVLRQVPPNKGLWVHTAGSVPMSVFDGLADRYGVLYPLQSLTKDRAIDFAEVPLFLEANSEDAYIRLNDLANTLSNRVTPLSSDKRAYLHLAAVFASNFVNHLYVVANEITDQQGIDFDALFPLIEETAKRTSVLKPRDTQTGPAVRNDQKVMKRQYDMLKDHPNLQELYALISQSIAKQ